MTTSKKKSAPKKHTTKPKVQKVTLKEYGNTYIAGPAMTSLFGEYLPENPVEQAAFWKKKYEEQVQRTFTADQKVALLRTIINTALRSGGSSDYDN